MSKKIFIICKVRLADESYNVKLDEYVSNLEKEGHQVHLPKRDTNQNTTGFEICTQNMNAIKSSDEVHIFYDTKSQGIHFDMGVSFALNKPIVLVDLIGDDKYTFKNMLKDWSNHSI